MAILIRSRWNINVRSLSLGDACRQGKTDVLGGHPYFFELNDSLACKVGDYPVDEKTIGDKLKKAATVIDAMKRRKADEARAKGIAV